MSISTLEFGIDVEEVSPAQGREILDQAAQRYLNMSGEEFIAAWNAGKFDDDPDRPEVMRVVMLLPFAR